MVSRRRCIRQVYKLHRNVKKLHTYKWRAMKRLRLVRKIQKVRLDTLRELLREKPPKPECKKRYKKYLQMQLIMRQVKHLLAIWRKKLRRLSRKLEVKYREEKRIDKTLRKLKRKIDRSDIDQSFLRKYFADVRKFLKRTEQGRALGTKLHGLVSARTIEQLLLENANNLKLTIRMLEYFMETGHNMRTRDPLNVGRSKSRFRRENYRFKRGLIPVSSSEMIFDLHKQILGGRKAIRRRAGTRLDSNDSLQKNIMRFMEGYQVNKLDSKKRQKKKKSKKQNESGKLLDKMFDDMKMFDAERRKRIKRKMRDTKGEWDGKNQDDWRDQGKEWDELAHESKQSLKRDDSAVVTFGKERIYKRPGYNADSRGNTEEEEEEESRKRKRKRESIEGQLLPNFLQQEHVMRSLLRKKFGKPMTSSLSMMDSPTKLKTSRDSGMKLKTLKRPLAPRDSDMKLKIPKKSLTPLDSDIKLQPPKKSLTPRDSDMKRKTPKKSLTPKDSPMKLNKQKKSLTPLDSDLQLKMPKKSLTPRDSVSKLKTQKKSRPTRFKTTKKRKKRDLVQNQLEDDTSIITIEYLKDLRNIRALSKKPQTSKKKIRAGIKQINKLINEKKILTESPKVKDQKRKKNKKKSDRTKAVGDEIYKEKEEESMTSNQDEKQIIMEKEGKDRIEPMATSPELDKKSKLENIPKKYVEHLEHTLIKSPKIHLEEALNRNIHIEDTLIKSPHIDKEDTLETKIRIGGEIISTSPEPDLEDWSNKIRKIHKEDKFIERPEQTREEDTFIKKIHKRDKLIKSPEQIREEKKLIKSPEQIREEDTSIKKREKNKGDKLIKSPEQIREEDKLIKSPEQIREEDQLIKSPEQIREEVTTVKKPKLLKYNKMAKKYKTRKEKKLMKRSKLPKEDTLKRSKLSKKDTLPDIPSAITPIQVTKGGYRKRPKLPNEVSVFKEIQAVPSTNLADDYIDLDSSMRPKKWPELEELPTRKLELFKAAVAGFMVGGRKHQRSRTQKVKHTRSNAASIYSGSSVSRNINQRSRIVKLPFGKLTRKDKQTKKFLLSSSDSSSDEHTLSIDSNNSMNVAATNIIDHIYSDKLLTAKELMQQKSKDSIQPLSHHSALSQLTRHSIGLEVDEVWQNLLVKQEHLKRRGENPKDVKRKLKHSYLQRVQNALHNWMSQKQAPKPKITNFKSDPSVIQQSGFDLHAVRSKLLYSIAKDEQVLTKRVTLASSASKYRTGIDETNRGSARVMHKRLFLHQLNKIDEEEQELRRQVRRLFHLMMMQIVPTTKSDIDLLNTYGRDPHSFNILLQGLCGDQNPDKEPCDVNAFERQYEAIKVQMDRSSRRQKVLDVAAKSYMTMMEPNSISSYSTYGSEMEKIPFNFDLEYIEEERAKWKEHFENRKKSKLEIVLEEKKQKKQEALYAKKLAVRKARQVQRVLERKSRQSIRPVSALFSAPRVTIRMRRVIEEMKSSEQSEPQEEPPMEGVNICPCCGRSQCEQKHDLTSSSTDYSLATKSQSNCVCTGELIVDADCYETAVERFIRTYGRHPLLSKAM